mmetsp:Transcript_21671/g.84406  ORF Transcript_21671/g.84406 Transcript_21671/m.84406 type:complete len:326 (-) Transcript_21671:2195-3172(-)
MATSCNARPLRRRRAGQTCSQCGCYKFGNRDEQQREHTHQPHPRRRRRRPHPRPAAALPHPGRLRGAAGRGQPGPEQATHPRDGGPDRAGPDAARRRRPDHLPPAARRQRQHAHHHADRQGRGRGPHRRPGGRRGRLSRQALQSARTAGPHQRGAAPPPAARSPGRAEQGADDRHLRPLRVRPRAAPADQERRAAAADHRRVLDAQDPGAPPAPALEPRQAGPARPRPRVRALRPQPGRADLAAAQDARGRPGPAALHPDRLGRGLRLRARREHVSPSPSLAALNAGKPGRSPGGTKLLAASSRNQLPPGRLGAARRSAPNRMSA